MRQVIATLDLSSEGYSRLAQKSDRFSNETTLKYFSKGLRTQDLQSEMSLRMPRIYFCMIAF